jgi:hypothetical protein
VNRMAKLALINRTFCMGKTQLQQEGDYHKTC